MNSADRVTAALLLAAAVAFSAGAIKYYPYWGEGGPGSAFLPFWLGLVMAALAVLMLVRKPRNAAVGLLPQGEGRKRVLVVIGATAIFIAALKIIGMVLGTALYLIVLMRFLERHRWPLTLAVAAAAAGINYLVFAYWLRVPFPEGMFWIF
jgi:putative tricarboxylic transport membrane protein